MSPDKSLDQHVVTAVVVAHDGAGWLPRVAEGVLQQTRPVQRAVAVDTGSRDRSGAMLAGLFGRGAVFGMDRATGYAAAVTHALRHRAASTHVPGSRQGERTEWIWLIHDDCEPAPDALAELLRAASATPAAAVLGPKVMDWTDRRVILEAGITIDRAGRRITGVEPREVDQGQHDGDRDVLAVSSAGMLIRRDVWDQLGGFDTGMRLFREDVDFCWRAQAAGHRVRLVTDAVVYHVEASARNRRQTSAAPRPRREDRQNGLTTLLGNLPAGPLLRVLTGNAVLSLLRTLFYLVAKRPGAGADEITALLAVAGHPLRLHGIRKPRVRGRRASYARLRGFILPARTVGRLFEFLAAAWSKSAPVDTIGSHHATEDPSDDDSLLIDTGFAQRILTSPGVLLFLGLTTISLVAERSLLGSGPLGGGALIPAWGGASGLWQEYLQGFHPSGIGSVAAAPPYVAVLAFLATLLAGKTWLAVDVLLIGCVPLAGLTAYLAARRLTRSTLARVWAAAAYALLPAGMGAVAAGRLGAALVFVLLPLIGLLAARIFTQPARRARRAAWAVALLTAVAAAFAPVTWLIVGVLTGLGGLLAGRSRPGMGLNLAIVAVAPPLVLLPWSLQLAASPARLFLESGLAQPGLAQPGLSARSLLLLSPGGPGLPPFWMTAGLLVAALVAVAAGGRRPALLAGWGMALAGLLIAVGTSQLTITPPGGGPAVPAWPGVVLAVAGAGLALAAATAADALPALLGGGRWRAPAGLGALLLIVVAASAPVLAAANWVMTGVAGPVARVGGQVLPEFVSVAASTGERPRTLVLRPAADGSVSYEVLRDSDPLIGSETLTPPPGAQRVLDTAVAALAAPSGGEAQDQGRALAALGIGYVLLPAPGSPALARLLDGVAGLRPVSQTSAFQLWRVVDTPARVRVIGAGGQVVPVRSQAVGVTAARVPAGGGELVLAEPAGGWSASLNGQPLTPLPAPVDGWAQGFRLPAGGGTLSISHSQLGRDAVVLLEALAVLAMAVLGLPGARLAGEQSDEAAAGSRQRPPSGGRSRGAGERQPGRRSREAVPAAQPSAHGDSALNDSALNDSALGGPALDEPALNEGELAGLAARAAGDEPGAADSSQRAAAALRRGEDDAAGRPPWATGGAGAAGDARSGAGAPADVTALAAYPAGGPAGAAARAGRGRPDPGAGGGRAARRAAGLLGRGRGDEGGEAEPAAAGAQPPAGAAPSAAGARGRRRLGRGRKEEPGTQAGGPRGRGPADADARGGMAGGRRGYPGAGEAGQPDAYGSGRYPAGGYESGSFPAGGYESGSFPAGGYESGSFPARGYESGSFPAGGYESGSFPAGAHQSGSYPAGGYESGSFPAGGYESGSFPAGGYESGSFPAGGHQSGGYPAAGRHGGDAGGRVSGRRGRRGADGRGDPRGGAGDQRGGADDPRGGAGDPRGGADDPRGGEPRGGAGDPRGGDGEDRGGAGRGRGRRALGRRGGDRGDRRGSGGGDRRGSGSYPDPGYGTGGYPAGDYPPGGHRAGGHRPGEPGPGGPAAGGYPAGGYPAGEYPAGGGTGGSPAEDYGTGGYGAGEYGAGEYGAGEYGTGGFGTGGFGTGGFRAGEYGAGEHGAGKYGTGGYGAGGYGAGDDGAGGGRYGDAGDGYPDAAGGYPPDDRGGAGGGRRRALPGRGTPGRGKPGRRPGRGERR